MQHVSALLRILTCLLLLSVLTLSVTATGGSAITAIDTATLQLLPATTVPPVSPPATGAASHALFDPVSGRFLATQDADTRRPMASTTKIMTALVVLETLSLTETVTVPTEAVGTEGSSIYLFAGEEITVETLLYALLLSSANDAAVALAIHSAGSIEAFARLMNEKTAAMGLENTHFCNPHGLQDPAHYTTARELALITAAALQNKTFAKIVSTQRYSAPQIGTDACRLFLNHNRLLRTFDGAIGVKTGFTKASGRCLVSAANRNGLSLIAVTLNAPNDWRDHAALLEWGFSQYIAFAPEAPPLSLPVVGGTVGEVRLLPSAAVSLTLPAQHPEITCITQAPRFLFAGFAAGEVRGKLLYYMGDELLAKVDLLTEQEVAAVREKPSLWERIKNLFGK